MKKLKLFLAACAAMVGLSANAQSWTSPGSDPVNDGQYYILNVGAGQFVTAANDWGTQLSATGTDTGLLIKTQAVSNVTVGGASLSGWELLNTNNSNKLLFRDSERWGYTDKGTQDKGYVWTITKVNGVYRLQTAAGDPAYPAASTQYAGANASLNGARVYFGYNSSSTDIDWIFLTEDQKGTANIVAKARLYRALMKAYAAGVNTDEASAVYESGSSTAEEMNAAVTTLNNACLQAHLDNASDSDPRDITEFVLSNSDFTQGNITGWETNYVSGTQATNIGYQDNNTYQSANGFVNKFIEAWRSGNANIGDGYLRQTVSNMPEGKYVLECDAIATNQGNTSATTTGALLFINADGVDFTTSLSTNGSAVQHFSTEFLFTGEGDVIFGLKTQSTTANWIAADNFKVTYYGIDLTAYETQLAAAVDAFEALEGTVPSGTYNDKKTDVLDVYNKEWTSSKDYSTAISAIQTATSELNALVTEYAHYQRIRTAVLAVSSSVDVSTADNQANAAESDEDLAAAIQTVRNALTAYLGTVELSEGQTFDLTDALLENAAPGVSGTTDYWTNSQTPSLQYQLWEYYNKSGATTKQTIAAQLPVGNYKLTAVAFTRTGYEAKLNAGDVSTNIATVSSNEVNDRNSGNTWIAAGNGVTDLVFNLASATSNLEIGLTADNANGDHWMCWRSFRLIYGDVFESYTLAEGKMNKDVAAAQAQADATFKANPSPATYMEVINAIAAAEASIKAYAPMTAAVDKIDAALAAATSATESTDAYNAVKAAYTEATIADADIMAQVAAAYDAVIPVIKSQTAANADFTLAIQNQSFEYGDMTGWTATESSDTGVRETSNATYAATGSDGYYLFNTWWQGVPLTQTVTGLPNGEYTLTASVASDGATIYLLANGEHNEGTETGNAEVTTYPTKDTFQEATFTFLVKDGNATIGVVGGADGTAGEHKDYVEAGYWWYKADNFRLVKNRDLTEEEMAVAPTAITLFNGETEVTDAIALDATTTSVTLTPQFTPADATPTVTWASSDDAVATVADGVVTAVSSGTTTITVKSTLDENVSASATVTVSFPETEVAAYTNDGATRYVHHYGDNIIKNGTFQYPNPFQGWKSGANGNCDANNFNIVTEDENKYIQAKQSTGAGDSHSISTGWPIEAGKTYVFGYKVKASKAGTMQFLVTSLTNSIGTETAQLDTENERKAKSVTTSWTDVKYEFTNSDNYAFVQFRARWMADSQSFDDFYLVEKTADDDVIGNVQYALDAIPTANIGTGAFQYSQDAIDAANALVQGEATVEEVQAAYDALTTLNAPADGQLFNVILTYSGWTYDNKAMTFIANGRTDQGNYNIQYKEEANQNLAQAFTFTKVEGNNYKMSQIDADGVARYISTGVPYSGNTAQIRTVTNADDALVVTVIPTTTDGKWNLRNTAANNYIGSQDAGVYTVNSHIDFNIVETSKPSITINTTAAGWGTTILPFAVAEIPEGVKVYSCAEADGATLTLVEVTALEANKPYIIEGAWNATLTGDAQGTALSYTEGLLTGTYVLMEAEALNGKYIMQKQGEKVGFFLVNSENAQPKLKANRAYMTAPATGSVKAFLLGDDAADAIQSVFDGLVNGDAYDLGGRKVSKLQKGNVYIVNGKKVVVK